MKPFAWSYSQLTRYENCPKQYYHIAVARDVKDEYGDSDAGAEGTAIHLAMYNRVIKGTPLPLNFRHFEKTAAPFAAMPGDKHGELKLALNRAFQPTDFFADDVYLRVVIDFMSVVNKSALLVDWKTGKPKPDFTQLAMSAGVVAQLMPEIDSFTVAFVYLKHKKISKETYKREDFKEIWAGLIKRADAIEAARKTTDFPATPSGLCGYCPVQQCPNHRDRSDNWDR